MTHAECWHASRIYSTALRDQHSTGQMGSSAMNENAFPSPRRFLVRQGSKGWMVYDRERKGPAMLGTNPAVNLTKEKAVQIEWVLVAKEPKHSP